MMIVIRNCQERTATCTECKLLLQAVEVFNPGWINAHGSDDGLLVTRCNDVHTVYLGLVKELRGFYVPAEVDATIRETASFQIFRRSQGKLHLNHMS